MAKNDQILDFQVSMELSHQDASVAKNDQILDFQGSMKLSH